MGGNYPQSFITFLIFKQTPSHFSVRKKTLPQTILRKNDMSLFNKIECCYGDVTAAERTVHEWTTELPVNFLFPVTQRKVSQTIKFLLREIQKQKVRVSEKKVEKRLILLERFFSTLAKYLCTKGFTTCTKEENYASRSEPCRSRSTRALFLFLLFVMLA